VDEAAYCPLIKAGVLFSFGVPVALFGDHMQLPPICEMDRKAITSTAENKPVFLFDLSAIYFADLFDNDVNIESIYQTYVYNKPPLFNFVDVTFLTQTFRFSQRLASILDTYIYRQGFHGNEGNQTDIIVIDAPRGISSSELRSSPAEAKAIQKYLEINKPSNYIILAPYKAQCRTIERELNLPVGSVLTIHASQGREWDTVILSVTDARNPFFMSSNLAKSNGSHIINTAVSRTRQKLVLVLDFECWKNKKGELISDIANSANFYY
jgi:superfamily I DNA and/or RNA helicase